MNPTFTIKALLASIVLCAAIMSSNSYAAAHPERRGIGVSGFTKEDFPPEVKAAQEVKKPPIKIDARRSLFVTEKEVLQAFTFSDVMDTLAKRADANLTKEKLFNDWWANAAVSSDASIGCGPVGTANNTLLSQFGFDYLCPRAEGGETAAGAFAAGSDEGYFPIALANRFDLASSRKEGALDCGEYRIVFARRSGATKSNRRNFIIFEAVLPNPAPGKVTGCQPIVAIWASLSQESDPKKRAAILRDFYFNGIPAQKVAPVISPAHYGSATNGVKGQIRTNQFIHFGTGFDSPWVLREFAFVNDGALSRISPNSVKANPPSSLFVGASRSFQAKLFQDDFIVTSVETLTAPSINSMHMAIEDRNNAAESRVDGTMVNFESAAQGNTLFKNRIAAVKRVTDTKLSAEEVLRRASALTCAGCHQEPNNADLGGNLKWPSSLGFVHTSESAPETDPGLPPSFLISPALKEFLKFRQCLTEKFLRRDWRQVCK